MTEKKPGDIMPASSNGVFREFVMRLKLILRLMGDNRVSFLLKLLPIGALAYLISPVDLAPGLALPIIGALDDAAVVSLGAYLFVELCPPGVVKEHLSALASGYVSGSSSSNEVVDAEVKDITDEK